jgi:OOP family OmpA-OmpF porin
MRVRAGGIGVLLWAVGCAGSQTPIVTTEGEKIDPDEIIDVKVVVEKCAIPDLQTYFEFDSDEIESSDNLNKLAKCLTDGPLRASRILLIGSTDSVGSERYNDKLGLSRARKVAAYLIKLGVEEKRIKYTSIGKSKASASPGSSVKDRSKDRRVDISVLL